MCCQGNVMDSTFIRFAFTCVFFDTVTKTLSPVVHFIWLQLNLKQIVKIKPLNQVTIPITKKISIIELVIKTLSLDENLIFWQKFAN